METSVYILGSEPFEEWRKRNGNATSIALKGEVSANVFCQFDSEFDYSQYEHISFEGLKLLDIVCENGFVCPLEDRLIFDIYENAIRLSVLSKLYLNTQISKDFVVMGDCIYTSDRKTLVHIPETKSIHIPEFVEHIGIAAFSGYEDMEELIINAGLKTIGKYAFVGAGIACLNMPDTVVSIGEHAFLMADLERVRLSNSLEVIPYGCFSLCFLVELSIPSSVRTIDNCTFRSLHTYDIIIPEGVERIGYDAFEDLDSISLPSTLMEVAPDFYYEEGVDAPDNPPYITVHPDNKIYVSIDGSLYFKESGKLAIDSEYHGRKYD